MTPQPPGSSSRPPYPSRGGNGFVASTLHAWNGLVHTVVFQRNMRIHVTAAILVGLVGSGIPLGLAEKVTLIFCVLLVFFAEILNSALEALVDLATRQFDEKARVTKDAAAAGVLTLSIGTAVIFAALLVHNWDTVLRHVPEIQRQVLLGVPFTACAVVLMRDQHKTLGVDVVVFTAGLALFAALTWTSASYVFSAMTLGIFVLTLAAAIERRRGRAPPSART